MVQIRKIRPRTIPQWQKNVESSDSERDTLRKSLEQARADIAAGNYEVLTSSTLRRKFEAVFKRRKIADEGEKL